MIYFAQLPTGAIKIGYTEDVDQRTRSLGAHYSCDVEILHTMEGDRSTEQALHERFAHLRFGRTEQFRPGRDLVEFIGLPLFVSANPEAVEAQPVNPNLGQPARLDPSLVSMARMIAAGKGITIGAYLEPMIAPTVRKDYAAMLRELEKEGGSES